MHHRKIVLKAFIGSLATFFVFTAGFYAFSAYALTDLSKSLNIDITDEENEASASEATSGDTSSESEATSTSELEEGSTPGAQAKVSTFKVLVDASGSMSENFGGQSKIDAVKSALEQGVNKVADSNPISVYAAGSVESSQDKALSCEDVVELTKDLGNAPSSADVIQSYSNVSPRGNAPLAYGIEQVATSYTVADSGVFLLIADGADNCDGNIVAAGAAFAEQAPNVSMYTIGLNVDAQVSRDLQQISEETKGQFFDVEDSSGLTAAILAAANKVSSTRSLASADPIEVEAGESIAKARIFGEDDFDKVYTPKDHLDANTYEFWKLTLAPGQGAEIMVETSDEDVSFTEGSPQVNDDAPSAGITVFGSDEQQIFDVSIQQEKNATKTGNIFSVSADREEHVFYLGVGYSLPVHKDMKYSVRLVEEYDEATVNSDAPNTLNDQFPLLSEGDQVGYLSKSDLIDYYAIRVGNGQELTVSATSEDVESMPSLYFYNEDADILDSIEDVEPGQDSQLSFAPTEDTDITVGIRDVVGAYALSVSIDGERITDDSLVAPVIDADGQDLINVNQATDTSLISPEMLRWIIIASITIGVFAFALVVALGVISRRRKNKKNDSGMPKSPSSSGGGMQKPEMKNDNSMSASSEVPKKSSSRVDSVPPNSNTPQK